MLPSRGACTRRHRPPPATSPSRDAPLPVRLASAVPRRCGVPAPAVQLVRALPRHRDEAACSNHAAARMPLCRSQRRDDAMETRRRDGATRDSATTRRQVQRRDGGCNDTTAGATTRRRVQRHDDARRCDSATTTTRDGAATPVQ
ncbi:hypothetical protein BJ912DRAFT_933944 [Pholiota molesta]|nr:hypothetical protein BJ912DRAFT_933944 [Pholiota molesta]